jgi:hypothetical protein
MRLGEHAQLDTVGNPALMGAVMLIDSEFSQRRADKER